MICRVIGMEIVNKAEIPSWCIKKNRKYEKIFIQENKENPYL